MNKKVLLGMSGGVDSSVSAILLQKQGYEVIGATMQLYDNSKKMNCSKEEKSEEAQNEQIDADDSSITDAKKVCEKLGIEHHVIDLREEFQKRVINHFICSYACAKTPNPCVECNKYMKFQAFYKIAQELGCDYIATGHYAKIEYSEQYQQYVLTKSKADKKDQTYFLYGIEKEILPHILFPLAEFTEKEEIRKIAEENGLGVAKKKDSQEVCFIPDNDYVSFLERNKGRVQGCVYNNLNNADKQGLAKKNNEETKNSVANKKTQSNQKGKIVLTSGEVLGEHNGLIYYTIGQRRGLGIAYKEPLYVIRLDSDKNEVVVGTEKELYSTDLEAEELNFLLDIDLTKPIEVQAKVRYRAKAAEAILMLEDKKNDGYNREKVSKVEKDASENEEKKINKSVQKNKIAKVTFKEPQRAVTPGQSVVFYLGDVVLGGGKIR